MLDMLGPVATNSDVDYTLTIEDVAERYAVSGHPRTLRTLQRYCASGHLECRKAATALGDKYLVTPQSVTRHIAHIAEFADLKLGTTAACRYRLPARPDFDQGRADRSLARARQGDELPCPRSATDAVAAARGRHVSIRGQGTATLPIEIDMLITR